MLAAALPTLATDPPASTSQPRWFSSVLLFALPQFFQTIAGATPLVTECYPRP